MYNLDFNQYKPIAENMIFFYKQHLFIFISPFLIYSGLDNVSSVRAILVYFFKTVFLMFDLNVYNLLIDTVELNRIEKKTISS